MGDIEVVGRMLLALGAVLFVVWLLARVVRRGKRHSDEILEVVGRKHLSKGVSLAVVRVGGRTVLVGVTDGRVSMLGDVDVDAVAAPDAEPAPPPRALRVAPPVAPPAAPVAAVPAPTTSRPRHGVPGTGPTRHGSPVEGPARPAGGPLAGSALSPATWKQSVEALRDLTVRSRVG